MSTVPIGRVAEQLRLKQRCREEEIAALEKEALADDCHDSAVDEVEGRKCEICWIERMIKEVLFNGEADHEIPGATSAALDAYNEFWKHTRKSGYHDEQATNLMDEAIKALDKAAAERGVAALREGGKLPEVKSNMLEWTNTASTESILLSRMQNRISLAMTELFKKQSRSDGQ